MATFKELAKGYADRINNAGIENRVKEFRNVQSDIEGLVYVSNHEKLSNADKVEIYESIKSELRIKTVGFSLPGRPMFECANDEVMVMIDDVIKSMGGK